MLPGLADHSALTFTFSEVALSTKFYCSMEKKGVNSCLEAEDGGKRRSKLGAAEREGEEAVNVRSIDDDRDRVGKVLTARG